MHVCSWCGCFLSPCRRNYRQTWKWDDIEANVSSNYYPVNSRIYLRVGNSGPSPLYIHVCMYLFRIKHLSVLEYLAFQDEKAQMQFTVVNDRSQGGSSLDDGQVELMV